MVAMLMVFFHVWWAGFSSLGSLSHSEEWAWTLGTSIVPGKLNVSRVAFPEFNVRYSMLQSIHNNFLSVAKSTQNRVCLQRSEIVMLCYLIYVKKCESTWYVPKSKFKLHCMRKFCCMYEDYYLPVVTLTSPVYKWWPLQHASCTRGTSFHFSCLKI